MTNLIQSNRTHSGRGPVHSLFRGARHTLQVCAHVLHVGARVERVRLRLEDTLVPPRAAPRDPTARRAALRPQFGGRELSRIVRFALNAETDRYMMSER